MKQYQPEKNFKTQMEKRRNVEESATKQKARFQWLKEEYLNTA